MIQNKRYGDEYLNTIYKLLKKKDHKHSEKRLLLENYEGRNKGYDKFYLTGLNHSHSCERDDQLNDRKSRKIKF